MRSMVLSMWRVQNTMLPSVLENAIAPGHGASALMLLSVRPLVGPDLSVAFYDMNTIRAEGLATVEGDMRKFDPADKGLIARRFMLGGVQTSEGLSIYHEVFDGRSAETKTLPPIVKMVMDRLCLLRRLVLVVDRDRLSLNNLEALHVIRVSPDKRASASVANCPPEFDSLHPQQRPYRL